MGDVWKSINKIIVLIWTDILAAYALYVMMPYLTNVWKMKFTHAAAVINVYIGVATILPLGFSFLVEAFIGNYWMLLFSSAAYSIGLGFLSMSTPPVLSKATGTCNTYESACIGEVQKILFYTALPLIAIGLGGHLLSLGSFIAEQVLAAEVDENESDNETATVKQIVYAFLGFFAVVLITIISATALAYIKPWSVRFGIPAICSVIAMLVFLSGSRSYVYVEPTGSTFTRLFRVFVASTLKIHLPRPKDPAQLYEKVDSENELLVPHTSGLRCLDKAAIIKSSPAVEDQAKNRWMLCRVTEVEETKIVIRMIPMWLTFIAIGIVLAIGNTFFLEQADRMNRKVGKLKIPLPMFLMFYDTARSKVTELYYFMASCLDEKRRKYAPAIGIGAAMLLAILCCITAAKVEERRIGVIKEHGLLDKPKERIPMTIFWLLPQFLLLGALEGLAYESVGSFFGDQVPPSMRGYMMLFTSAVFGAGRIGSVLSVHIVSKVSERGGKPSWFGETLDKSRLDKYYWTLAALSAVNLVLYVLIAIWYAYRDSIVEEEEGEEEEDYGGNGEIDGCCCC